MRLVSSFFSFVSSSLPDGEEHDSKTQERVRLPIHVEARGHVYGHEDIKGKNVPITIVWRYSTPARETNRTFPSLAWHVIPSPPKPHRSPRPAPRGRPRRRVQDVMEEYRRTGRHTNHGMELVVEMLTTGYWPTQSGPKCRLPLQAVRCCEDFEEFYLQKHTVRVYEYAGRGRARTHTHTYTHARRPTPKY